jgi:hypothetical protein
MKNTHLKKFAMIAFPGSGFSQLHKVLDEMPKQVAPS